MTGPEADPDASANRLRTVLNRLKDAARRLLTQGRRGSARGKAAIANVTPAPLTFAGVVATTDHGFTLGPGGNMHTLATPAGKLTVTGFGKTETTQTMNATTCYFTYTSRQQFKFISGKSTGKFAGASGPWARLRPSSRRACSPSADDAFARLSQRLRGACARLSRRFRAGLAGKPVGAGPRTLLGRHSIESNACPHGATYPLYPGQTVCPIGSENFITYLKFTPFAGSSLRTIFKGSKRCGNSTRGSTHGREHCSAERRGIMGIVVIVALVIAAGWWVDVRVHPFRRCPRCNGKRRNPGSSNSHWGNCSRCRGRGEVRRFGAPEK